MSNWFGQKNNGTPKTQILRFKKKEDSLNIKEFSEQSHVALRNVLAEINTSLADSSELYGAVKQIRSNRFMVDINEELQPFYLETLLKKAFMPKI